MISSKLEKVLNIAFEIAYKNNHEFVTVEHLLLSLLDERAVRITLSACGADISSLKEGLKVYIRENAQKITTPGIKTQPTIGFQRVLQRAIFHVQSSKKSNDNDITKVYPVNVLVSIFSEEESFAVYILHDQNVTRLDIINFLSHGLAKNKKYSGIKIDSEMTSKNENSQEELNEASDSEISDTELDEKGDDDKKGKVSFLEKYATNLNKKAQKEMLDPLIGREYEVSRLLQTLARRKKNNPLLVGEAGVGKTAIVEGFAKLIVEKRAPKMFTNSIVYDLDISSIMSGTKYRGDFEKRLKKIINEAISNPNIILFIDEIHMIVGAGSTSGSSVDASNMLKPYLSSGEMKCIGSTTYKEYRENFEKDYALARRFQKIDIEEPSVDDSYKILKGLKLNYEEYHSIKYTDKALKAAANLSYKHIRGKYLPDKAIDVIDEIGAYYQINKNKNKKIINTIDVEKMVAKIARIPEKNVSKPEKENFYNLEQNLKLVIFGQNEAIESVNEIIKLSKLGLVNDEKPIGSFLLAGPTGVGKTELCKQLAKFLGIKLLRFDMSEYMEKHSVARLIGAPPGYVGFEQAGLLSDSVEKNPHCVILFDEVEKANSDLTNILLQIMDYGTLTDNTGKKIDFRNTIIFMTSNVGANALDRKAIGFNEQTDEDTKESIQQSIKISFAPEFRNRLDAIINFNQLTKDMILQVIDKFISELQVKLDEKKIDISLSKKSLNWLSVKGSDEKMGARPMARIIQKYIKIPIANEILYGKLQQGGKVKIDCKSLNDDKLLFKYTPSQNTAVTKETSV